MESQGQQGSRTIGFRFHPLNQVGYMVYDVISELRTAGKYVLNRVSHVWVAGPTLAWLVLELPSGFLESLPLVILTRFVKVNIQEIHRYVTFHVWCVCVCACDICMIMHVCTGHIATHTATNFPPFKLFSLPCLEQCTPPTFPFPFWACRFG